MPRIVRLSHALLTVLAVSSALAVSVPAAKQEDAALLHGSRRILFLGDSITAGGSYVAAFEAWLLTQALDPPPLVINMGLSSETVSGLSEEGHAGGKFPRPDLAERLDRVLALAKPELVFACYGINCGIYEPLDATRFQRYQEGMKQLKRKVEAGGATFVVITPPSYDDRRGKKPFSYNTVLGHYSDWLLAQRADGWRVIDLHGPMTAELHRRRQTEPDFTFQPDAVHPNAEGHWFMARQLIRWFGDAKAAAADSAEAMLEARGIAPEAMKLVERRMTVLRDAYVAAAGHKRPGVRAGLPVPEALEEARDLSEQIRQMTRQSPPLIVNQAADAVVNYLQLEKPLGQGATRAMALAALDRLVDQYEGTRVSHIFWNVSYQRAAYRSEVWPSYWDVDLPEQNITDWPRKYYELHNLGIDDVFEPLVARCRKRGISPWISLRMNDTHYANDATKISPLWYRHPELRTHETGGFDYAHAEVRAHYLKLIDEVLARWSTDGVELDWMRFPHHFKPNEMERGETILIEFMREVRRRTDAAAARWGHPVRIAARVPATPEFARKLALNGAAWAGEGLVDMLIPCSTWRPSYADVPVELWRGPPVAIVPGTDLWIRCTPRGPFMASSMETIRGFTASMGARTADGIYLFNHFQSVDHPLWYRADDGQRKYDHTTYDLLREAGDLAASTAGPRRHVLTFHDPVPPGCDNAHPLPATLTADRTARLRIHTGPKSARGECVVRVGLEPPEGGKEAVLAAKWNAVACRPIDDMPKPPLPYPTPEHPRSHVGEVAGRVVQFLAPLSAIQDGYNEVELSLTAGAPPVVVWFEVRIDPNAPDPL